MNKKILALVKFIVPAMLWVVLSSQLVCDPAIRSSKDFPFVVFFVFSFLLGSAGFYNLAKAIFKDELSAYYAFLLFLFSSVGMLLFNQFLSVLHFVSGVWIFNFLVRFYQISKAKYFVGLVIGLWFSAVSYSLVYHLTVLLITALAMILFYPADVLPFVKRTSSFVCRHPIFFVVALLGFLFSFWAQGPVYRQIQSLTKVKAIGGEISDVQKKGEGLADIGWKTDGALSARMSQDDLYSNLGRIDYGNDGFFYVSIFCYLVLMMGAFMKTSRLIIYLIFVNVFLFLLLIANAFWGHRFLYEHVLSSRLISHLPFLLPFMIAAFILLVIAVFQRLWAFSAPAGWRRWMAAGVVSFFHFGALFFLLKQENIIATSYMTLIVSFSFCVWFIFRENPQRTQRALWVLLVVILLQPIQVIWSYNAAAEKDKGHYVAQEIGE